MSVSNQLAEITFRLDVQQKNGIATGTGFLYSAVVNTENNTSQPLLITNKHVVEDGISGRIIVTVVNTHGKTEHLKVDLTNFPNLWHDHPDKNIDLTAMPISSVIAAMQQAGLAPRVKCLFPSDIPTDAELESLNFVEDVLMIGYPNGLWDDVNNYPLFRKGITATHPGKAFKGKKEFVIDIAAFPGSSGSPIFLYNEGSYATNTGLTIGSRVKILGVLYAGPQYTADGKIIIQTVPTQQMPLSKTLIPMNLGYAISSQELLRFVDVFK
jgi:hypothetical protein